MPQLTIDNDLLAEEFFEDSCLMGIMAPVPDYHFCNLLKEQLGLTFKNDLSSEIQLKRKNRNYFFSVFRFNEVNSPIEHVLYNNRHDGRYLLPECRHIDYVWMIHGQQSADAPVQELMHVLRSLKEVLLLAELSADKVKHKKNLIL
jgi:hypothetical protein